MSIVSKLNLNTSTSLVVSFQHGRHKDIHSIFSMWYHYFLFTTSMCECVCTSPHSTTEILQMNGTKLTNDVTSGDFRVKTKKRWSSFALDFAVSFPFLVDKILVALLPFHIHQNLGKKVSPSNWIMRYVICETFP